MNWEHDFAFHGASIITIGSKDMKIKCAAVEWIDSMHQDNWVDGEELGKVKYEYTCGILVKEQEDFITIALSHAVETKQYGHIISIPRVAIRSCQIFTRSVGEKPKAKRAKRAAALPEAGASV